MSMVIVITGVSGSGKTAVGQALATRLGWAYYEADNFHPASNIEKMRQGEPLCDEDRQPWLVAIRDQIKSALAADQNAVVSCSGLKKAYRDMLRVNDDVKIVSLNASRQLLEERLKQRQNHFFNPSLLDSQLAAWEPAFDSDLRIEVNTAIGQAADKSDEKSVEQIVSEIQASLTRRM